MSDHAGVAKADLGIDLPAHEETYAGFVSLTENLTVHLLNIVLLLVLWGLEGHPFVALVGFILNIAASALAGITGLGWRLPAGVFVLLGLACIVL
ncbi:MAG: aa3-type cytochrome c oxidase subunit IV [Pseudomonadota bacterium]|nr:aa3-type cytochrome c oxidase subunit IV [Pseudomonadota bacterium]